MRKPLIILALLALAFTTLMLLGGRAGDAPRREAGDYQPSGWLRSVGELLLMPFAPRLRVMDPACRAGDDCTDTPQFSLVPGGLRRVPLPASGKDQRIGMFALVSGPAVRLSYDCGAPLREADRRTCREQVLCLVDGPRAPPGCPAGSVTTNGRLIILGVGGTLTLEALGGPAVVALR